MKTLFIFSALLTIGGFCVAQTTTPPAPDPVVLKESSFDFGRIQQGRPVTHEFSLLNTGADTLKIDDVRASCGCTTPVWKHEPVAPHVATTITVGYNAYSEGPFEKTVSVLYNSGKMKLITIKGIVYKAPPATPENKSVQALKQSGL